jgi:hypothetical protein
VESARLLSVPEPAQLDLTFILVIGDTGDTTGDTKELFLN